MSNPDKIKNSTFQELEAQRLLNAQSKSSGYLLLFVAGLLVLCVLYALLTH